VQPLELEQYLHAHIPLSRAMAVGVVSIAPDSVALRAPLAPNTNHRDTIFGGSASALAIVAAWSLLHVRLSALGLESRLVIQRNTMDYQRPMAGEFTARAALGDEVRWARFIAMLARRHKARITVAAVLECAGEVSGSFSGEFVALGDEVPGL
jgi:thioesterase domain-containing protein